MKVALFDTSTYRMSATLPLFLEKGVPGKGSFPSPIGVRGVTIHRRLFAGL